MWLLPLLVLVGLDEDEEEEEDKAAERIWCLKESSSPLKPVGRCEALLLVLLLLCCCCCCWW